MSFVKGRSDYLKLGDWNAICDVCGFKFKASELRKRWDNLMVCRKDYETRHPMDFQKVPHTEQPTPWTRPEQPVTYKDVTFASVDDNTVPSGTFTMELD